MNDDLPERPDNPGQDPLDREALAAHFAGYEVEAPITVALSPVTLDDRTREPDA